MSAAGSRLPAPVAWPLLEMWHPATGAAAAESVAAALLWLVSLEAAGSAYLTLISPGENCRKDEMQATHIISLVPHE